MKPIKIVQLLLGIAIVIFGVVATISMLSELKGTESIGYKLGTLIPSAGIIAGGLYVVRRATKKSLNVNKADAPA